MINLIVKRSDDATTAPGALVFQHFALDYGVTVPYLPVPGHPSPPGGAYLEG
jgi:hypothetical protein